MLANVPYFPYPSVQVEVISKLQFFQYFLKSYAELLIRFLLQKLQNKVPD